MKNRAIQFARVVLFIVVFCCIFYYIQELVKPKWGDGTAGAHETTNALGFYEEPKDSIDVLLIGSSHIFFGSSPLKMWEEYGFTSYVRGSANQPPLISYYTLKDALKNQNPSVVVFEVGRMVNQFDPVTNDEWVARRGLDYMRLSDVKLEAISALNLGKDGASFIFPLLRYHSRWQELQESDFEYFSWERHNWTRGQYMGASMLEFE